MNSCFKPTPSRFGFASLRASLLFLAIVCSIHAQEPEDRRARQDKLDGILAGGGKLVLVVFTLGHANEREIIPQVARTVIDRMRMGR